jgi:Chaperone of endosialidase
VEVTANGQLGISFSSRQMKDDIRDMGEAQRGLVNLRPVTFRYKAEHANGSLPIEYGIAEEVAEIYPELVVLDKDGQPSGAITSCPPCCSTNCSGSNAPSTPRRRGWPSRTNVSVTRRGSSTS